MTSAAESRAAALGPRAFRDRGGLRSCDDVRPNRGPFACKRPVRALPLGSDEKQRTNDAKKTPQFECQQRTTTQQQAARVVGSGRLALLLPMAVCNAQIPVEAKFKHLGRWLSAADSGLAAVAQCIKSARYRCHKLMPLLRSRCLRHATKRRLVSVIVGSSLLFASETVALNAISIRWLRAFQQRVLRNVFEVRGSEVDGVYRCPSREIVLHAAGDVPDVTTTLRRRRFLAFDGRTMARGDQLPLVELARAFEAPQRTDGRRAWWTAQLRADRDSVGLQVPIVCVSQWLAQARALPPLPQVEGS